MTNRTQRLRSGLYQNTPEICLERTRLYTGSWYETEGKPIVVRRAMALAKVLNEMTIYIEDDELIVGNHASRPFSVPVFPEFSVSWIADELDTFADRPQDAFILREEDRKDLLRIIELWRGKTHYDRVMGNIVNSLPEPILKAFDKEGLHLNQVFSTIISTTDGDGHVVIDFEAVLSFGFDGLSQKAKSVNEALDNTLPENFRKRIFLDAVIIACKAAAEFGRRYALLAQNLADHCESDERRKYLYDIARVCNRVPAGPASTFREAIQSVWFAFLLSQIESNGHSMGLGRFDQYLYPYYINDIEEQRMTHDQAREMIECFWIKVAELNKLRSWPNTRTKTGYPMFQSLTLGGQTSEGLDASNELSYLCLEVTADLKLTAPTVVARIHPQTPEDFLLACCRANLKHGGGLPGLFNDQVAIPALLNMGVPIEDARNWSVLGCAEMAVPGKSCSNYGGGGFFCLLKLLEITLNGGTNPSTGICLCPGERDLSTFQSYKELEHAFKRQIEYYLKFLPICANAVSIAYAEGTPTPLLSAMMKHRIEIGLDVSEGGGPNYNNTIVQFHNSANLGNALAALKKLIFEDKLISGTELKDLLASNFSGSRGEEVRQILLNRAPKFGNDEDSVDLLTRQAINWFVAGVKKFKPIRGGVFGPTLQTITSNVPEGEIIGATPDGRRAGEPTSDNASPTAGSDLSGVTAAIKSVAKLEHEQHPNGTLFNLKILPSVIEGNTGMSKFAALIRTYFELGGYQIQFTLVSAETLKQAQAFPEQHPNLVVKVAGYSALFNMLDRSFQDQLIARTEHYL